MTMEEIIDFLKGLGIDTDFVNPDKYGFSRTIEFVVYDTTYRILWFCNESTLKIGKGDRPAQIPFKYMYLDKCHPLIKSNRSIGFSYVENKCEGIMDRKYPYEVFRIPIEIDF